MGRKTHRAVVKTAILVDGGFYRRRAQYHWGDKTGTERADELFDYCMRLLSDKHEDRELYRIFYYDCPPMEKKIYHPFLQQQIDFSKTDLYAWTVDFFTALKAKRKVALRMGALADGQAHYTIRPDIIKRLCRGGVKIEDLEEKDFMLKVEQKGVDMKIGIDIASLSYKHLVDQIILISGDSDFVPAAKLARREGIDFMLAPMTATIKPSLYEHIDGLLNRTFSLREEKQD
ncbi:MAG: NYN domain-containing protein [Eubacteriales bacterium]|nr:NYN domain-containing protein [Eubacteriales bacterium]